MSIYVLGALDLMKFRKAEVPNSPLAQATDYPGLIAAIRARPGMYLGRLSLTRFEFYMQGIAVAEFLHDLPLDRRLPGFDWDGFEQWANARFNPGRLSIRSFGMARRHAESEEAALGVWFDWYDQFLAERQSGGGGA